MKLYYFEGLLQQIETASPKDIAEIREELMEEGYIREQTKKAIKKENTKCKTCFRTLSMLLMEQKSSLVKIINKMII